MGCYTGYAHHADTNDLAYTARYRPVSVDDRTTWQVIYRDPNGEVIGRKTMDFSHHDFVAVAVMKKVRSGDIEGIRRDDDGDWRMVKRDGADGELQVEPIDLRARMVASNGIHPFVQAHFDALMEGKEVFFHLAMPGRLKVFPMRMERIDDTTVENERAVRFRATVDKWLVSWFADDLVLTYDPETKQLLAYNGPVDIQHEGDKPFTARVRYYEDKPPDAAPISTVCGSY